MNVIAQLEVDSKTGKVIPVSNGVDHSIKEKTFRLRIFHQNRVCHADVIAPNRAKAVEVLNDSEYEYAA
ncbi:MAG: hypothetical protein GF317_11115 [Candidatus Lokiarchaeota archaeon]|nr:hypothetical protein [Candidatus Lokiarchaeota archaeon]